MQLHDEQKRILSEYLEEFQKSTTVENEGEVVSSEKFDEQREKCTPTVRKPLTDYLEGKISIKEFKEQSSEHSLKKFPLWGFKSFSGQMQLNQFANNVADENKDVFFKKALTKPLDLNDAKKKINDFADFLRKKKIENNNPKSVPNVNQSFLLSYFWALQDDRAWPILYSSYKRQFPTLGVSLDEFETPGDQYIAAAEMMMAIDDYFLNEKGVKTKHPFWFSEHVLWKQFVKNSDTFRETIGTHKKKRETLSPRDTTHSWLPEIVSDLETLARNKETAWSKLLKKLPERAFETKVGHAFTLLGYQVDVLGQGTGREPDGIAISTSPANDGSYYAIIYDAKSSEKGFSIGTTDREITEYIKSKQKTLKRARVNKIFFAIVSSDFIIKDRTYETLKSIYRDTGVHVVLLRTSELLFIVEEKLKNVEIDHSRLESLFLEGGLLTKEKIVQELGS